MRQMLACGLVSAALVTALFVGRGASQGSSATSATRSYPPVESSALISHFSGGDGQPMTLTVIDPREQWIGVYHVDRASGQISLKSARKYTWDTQLLDFNSGKPLPQEIRSGLPR
jgi:hypothetical protein